MIGRRETRVEAEPQVEGPRGFDDFELKLGDIMRGERATMGKSLLDVQRELRIKATYIAAIENCDPSAFDTPGFIAGYVRSYARYLGMDPDRTFATFCEESGFTVAHGMSAQASVVRKQPFEQRVPRAGTGGAERDPFLSPNTPFAPDNGSFWSEIEPRAIASSLVLVALIAGIGYGGWMVLKQVQQVQVAPVEQTPVVLSDLDPLDSAGTIGAADRVGVPSVEALDRLYRPQVLDVPVLVARDAPISSLDPAQVGAFRPATLPPVQMAESASRPAETPPPPPQVVEEPAPTLRMVAVRPSWVRVRAADGSVIFEGIMEAGQSWEVPPSEEPPTLRAGESGAIYFALGDTHYGPVGESGMVTSNLPLSVGSVTERYAVADPQADVDLARMVAEARMAEQGADPTD